MHLDERTNISLYVVGACGSALTAALIWIMMQFGQVQSANAVQDVKLDQHDRAIGKQTELLSEVRDSLIRIEQVLKDNK